MSKKFWILMIVSAIVYFVNLGGTSIYILDEAKNAGCAMEMLQRNDWVTPTFNNELRTDKPPLHYFFMILSYKVLGVSPFAARLFSAFTGVLLILCSYWFISKCTNRKIAFYSCLIMLSSLQLSIQFHLAVPDPYLILWITLCLMFFYLGIHHNSNYILAAYAMVGLGFLTKGPVAVVLPAFSALLYLLIIQKLRWKSFLSELKVSWGILIFLVLTLPWYVAVGYATNGAWLSGFFINHNIDRYTSTMEGHGGFPFVSFVIMIAALLPFSVFILQSISLALSKRKEKPLLTFCLVIVVVFGAFFSFSKTILPSYPAPALPFLAILLGYYLNHFCKKFTHVTSKTKISLIANAVISCAIPLGVLFALSQEPSLHHLTRLSFLFLLLPLGSLVGWYFLTQGKTWAFIYSWSGSWILTAILFFLVAYPQVNAVNPIVESLPILMKHYPNHKIIGYKIFNPAYVTNLQQTIPVSHSQEQLNATVAGEKAIVLTRGKYLPEFSDTTWIVVYRKKDLFEKSETLILSSK